MTWDYYDYNVAEFYLAALINDDLSGMTDAECQEFKAWRARAHQKALKAGWKIGHWAVVKDAGQNWGVSAVSGLHATVRLMVYQKGINCA